MTTIGKNYKSGRTFDEVLALVKRDLRDALPKGVKISVRKEGCTYTNKIDVRVMSAPEEVLDWQKCTQYEREERYAHFIWPRNLTAFGPLVIHFRYATHGSVRRANCHPFRDGAAGVSFAHNGVLPVIPRGDKTDSETAFRRLLSPVIRLHGLGSPDLAAAVDEIIGGSRFAFLSDDARILTFGQFCGSGGCLYSNPNFL